MSHSAALITLRDGKTYAAASHRFEDGWLHIEGARYWRTGPNDERTRFGAPGAFSWPREDVALVRRVVGVPGPQAAITVGEAA